jgi:hypothetical protein
MGDVVNRTLAVVRHVTLRHTVHSASQGSRLSRGREIASLSEDFVCNTL